MDDGHSKEKYSPSKMAPQPQEPELSEPRVKDWGGSGAEERNMALPLKSSRNSNQICRSPRIWLEMETHGEFECMSLESERMKVRPEGMMLAQKLRYPCRDSSFFWCILLALRTLWMRVWALVIFQGEGGLLVCGCLARYRGILRLMLGRQFCHEPGAGWFLLPGVGKRWDL